MYINEDMPLGSELPLSFIYTLVSDPLGNEIPSYGEESSITIGVQGDVNYDGEVNVLDIVTIVSFAIYAEEPNDSQFWASDINNDGLIKKFERIKKLRSINQPTIPTTLEEELNLNIFLRCNQKDLKIKLNMENEQDLEVFKKVRDLKDVF